MGVEMHMGCLSCKKFLWLGSEKPYAWEGFQLQHHYVKSFMTWHSMPDCELFHADDGTTDIPWQKNTEEWEEDSRSRSFWSSNRQDKIVCAKCGISLEGQSNPIILAEWFQLCSTSCQKAYADHYMSILDYRIYDSSKDQPDVNKTAWTVACHTCNTYYTVESQAFTPEETYMQLALFLCEHMHKGYGLYKVYHYAEPCTTPFPWQHPDTAHEWKLYDDEI